MRSRASGGICGDSSAACRPATMSSLRRRAICVTRARSIARSSTGGRASARTTAPASPGSTSSRSQASRSRTSARWKNAAAPDSRYGTARSSNATATAWPSPRTERTSTHTSSGATSSRATSRSTSAATACACARSEVQRQNATSPPGSPRNVSPRARGGEDALARAERGLQPRDGRRSATRPGSPARSWSRPRGSGGWPGSSSAAAVTSPAAAPQAVAAAGPARSSRPAARRRARGGGARPAAHARGRCVRSRRKLWSTRSPTSSVPGLVEHSLVRAVERGELALARAVLGQRGGPRRVVGGRDELVLEPVDALDDRAEGGARVAAQVVVAQRQVVDPLEQHRQPVGGADRRDERVEPGLERLVVQQPRAEAVEGGDGQLLVGARQAVLEPFAQRVGGGRRVAEHEQRLGWGAFLHQVQEALGEDGRLAAPGPAQHEQRTAGVLDGGALVGAQFEHLRRIRPR